MKMYELSLSILNANDWKKKSQSLFFDDIITQESEKLEEERLTEIGVALECVK
jgi:hypothetical protein